MNTSEPVLGVVGPCAAGKTTLVDRLRKHGYTAKHIAQEHSYVKDMWEQISQPDVLVYLDVSYSVSHQRNPSDWSRKIYDDQVLRLEHAKNNADLCIQTDDKSPAQVFKLVISFLDEEFGN